MELGYVRWRLGMLERGRARLYALLLASPDGVSGILDNNLEEVTIRILSVIPAPFHAVNIYST